MPEIEQFIDHARAMRRGDPRSMCLRQSDALLRQRWFSFGELKSVFLELATDVHCDTGAGEIPSSRG